MHPTYDTYDRTSVKYICKRMSLEILINHLCNGLRPESLLRSLLSHFFIRSIEIICVFSRAFYDALRKSRHYSFTTPLSLYVNCEIRINFISKLKHPIFMEAADCGIPENIRLRTCVRAYVESGFMRGKTDKEEPSLYFLGVCVILDDGGCFPMLVLPRTRRKNINDAH